MKILVADDHELFLKGLELILSDVSDEFELVFAIDYTSLFNKIDEAQDFDLVLTDLAIPGANWLDEIENINNKLRS